MSFRDLLIFSIGKLIPDKWWIQLKYYRAFGKWCDFKNPQTYNEKLQWLKLYHRKPEQIVMVDKYEAKQYVADRIGIQHIIPTIGGPWNTFEEIDFSALPDKFVLKTTHDCGGVWVCTDKKTFDYRRARKFFKQHLSHNYYYTSREWPYKYVKPRIFAEQYMVDESGYELKDYKFFCFDGRVEALFIATDRGVVGEETKFDFFDANYNHLSLTNGHPHSLQTIKKPISFEQMKELASILSVGYPHLRVDLYDINGQIYFGELTFFHWSGLVPFNPQEWDKIFGDWLELPKE